MGPPSAVTPQPLTVAVDPTGLAPGTYEGTVTITSIGAGNSPVSFAVKLTVGTSTMLSADTSGLTFNYQTTVQQLPPAQIVNISSTGAPLNYTVTTASADCGGNWLNVVPASGPTPSQLTVAVTPTGITAPSTCAGTISVTAPGASNTLKVPVMFNVSADPLLNITPTSISFTAAAGSTATFTPKVISLTSTDPNTAIPFTVLSSTASEVPAAPWPSRASSRISENQARGGDAEITTTRAAESDCWWNFLWMQTGLFEEVLNPSALQTNRSWRVLRGRFVHVRDQATLCHSGIVRHMAREETKLSGASFKRNRLRNCNGS